jgi:hypothetical protein
VARFRPACRSRFERERPLVNCRTLLGGLAATAAWVTAVGCSSSLGATDSVPPSGLATASSVAEDLTSARSLHDLSPSSALDGVDVEARPSQDSLSAERDGVVPAIASLSIAVRVNPYRVGSGPTTLTGPEGIWTISQPRMEDIDNNQNGCLIGNAEGEYGQDFVCITDYAEILLLKLDRSAIIKAFPFVGVPPSDLHIQGDSLYCKRQGDGGLSDSMLCRISRTTFSGVVRVFPFNEESAFLGERPQAVPDGWVIDEPRAVVLWERWIFDGQSLRISGHSGSATVDSMSLELVELSDEG